MAKQRALITGGSVGIGAALADEFASHGHDLVPPALPGPGSAATTPAGGGAKSAVPRPDKIDDGLDNP